MQHTTVSRGVAILFASGAALVTAAPQVPKGSGRVADGELVSFVDRRVKDWQPTKDERRFDEIGWARDIRDAQRLAKQHNRPVFLFTYDGANMACYRC
jgi:hypothetical protein